MGDFNFGSVFKDFVGLGNTYLENQQETRVPTPDPATTTTPPVTAVDESGRSMTAQPNILTTMPTWSWFAVGGVVLLMLLLIIVALFN